MAASHNQLSADDCSSWGKDQSWAVVWFVLVISIGSFLFVPLLARIDSWMYHNKDQVNLNGVVLLDNEKYVENRTASFSIPSGQLDPRANGSYSRVAK